METRDGRDQAPGGVTGSGDTFVINHNGDNALITLRYKLQHADIQAAEEPFDAGGTEVQSRGSFIITRRRAGRPRRGGKRARPQGRRRSRAAPTVKMHPARAARVAIMHTWQSTQTEGWWRLAFDQMQIPFDYISTQDVAKDAESEREVRRHSLSDPAAAARRRSSRACRCGATPMPWKKTPQTPNIGDLAQTDDMRPGLG